MVLVQVSLDFMGKGSGRSLESQAYSQTDISPELHRKRTIEILKWIAGFFLVIWLLGFSSGIPLAVFLYLKVGSSERWGLSLALAAVSFGFIYGIMDRTLHIPFPEGILLLFM